MAARLYVKLWTTWYTSESHSDVSADALHVGPVLMTFVRWQPGRDDGWAELANGKPVSTAAIARRAKWSQRRTNDALLELVSVDTVARRPDGAWGFPKYALAQETADAARKRKVRGQSTGQSGRCPTHSGDEAENGSSSKKPPVVPKGDPTPLVAHVLAEMGSAVRELKPDLRGPRDTPANRKAIAKVTKAQSLTPELWTQAIRAQLESVRPKPENWGYLSLSTLCRPANMARLLEAPAPGQPERTQGSLLSIAEIRACEAEEDARAAR